MSQLAVRAGEPPSGVELLAQCAADGAVPTARRASGCTWQHWFAEVEETHTSLGGARASSARRRRTARGSRRRARCSTRRRCGSSAVDLPFDPQAGFCVRGGVFALRAVADVLRPPVRRGSRARPIPISISEDEFLEACDRLVEAAIPVRADREQAWRDFNGWRVNYDQVLIGLAGFVMAPYAPWSSDRSLRYRRPTFGGNRES